MPVGRIVLKEISESKKLSLLKTDGARLLYTWLIPHLNVNGCFSADPIVVRSRIFTRLNKSIEDINSFLDDLEDNNLIKRYSTDGDDFLIMPNFAEKQPKLDKTREAKVNIPLPTQEQLKSKSRVTPTQIKLNEVKLSEVKVDAPAPPFELPSKEQINEAAEPMIKQLIEKISKQLYDEKIFPEVYAFKNTMLKEKKNPRSVLHTLVRVYLKKTFDNEGAWGYCQKTIINESQNYNARDYQKTT